MEQLGKILIVDDNEDVLFALNLLLEPYTEKIKVATTPDRIEYFMTTFGPDIILLDMNFSRDAISGQEGFESLEQILNTLSLWYDVDVFFQSESAKQLVFTGYMKRYNDISEILNAITEVVGVNFTINGKTIIVSK